MNETQFQIEKLKLLLDGYIQLLKLYTSPGEKAYSLNKAIDFLRVQIREILK